MQRRLKVKLQYDGSAYHGWQIQRSGATIQGLLQEAIYRITGERVSVSGAGRTDAGVHAIEQVASFASSSGLDGVTLKRGLNAVLPRDVRVIDLHDTDGDFHPRYDAVKKRYVYLIANMEVVPVFMERYVWRIRSPLDGERMNVAAGFLRGSHDFSAFRGTGCGARNPVREVYRLEIEHRDEAAFLFARFSGNVMLFTIEADGFLRHMVRNIVGTLAEVGKGRIEPEEIRKILESRERRLAGPTAPAKGLFLDQVIYRL
jgi:tRNA pseudouridine38-40 synthase